MQTVLIIVFKLVNRMFGFTMSKARYFQTWKYMHAVSLRGIGRIQGWPIEKSGELDALNIIFADSGDHPVVVDVGSNIGQYCQAVLQQLPSGKKIDIHLFEPSAANMAILHDKFNLRKYPQASFFINQVALSDKEEEAYLYTDKEGSDLGSLLNLKLPIRPFDESRKELVKTQTLDHYLQSRQITHVDLLKIDVEGAEYDVFMGSVKALKEGHIRYIQFEFGAGNITSRKFFHDFWELLSPYYEFNLILSGGLVPIQKYSTDWEIFKTVNYLLKKKI